MERYMLLKRTIIIFSVCLFDDLYPTCRWRLSRGVAASSPANRTLTWSTHASIRETRWVGRSSLTRLFLYLCIVCIYYHILWLLPLPPGPPPADLPTPEGGEGALHWPSDTDTLPVTPWLLKTILCKRKDWNFNGECFCFYQNTICTS